MKTGNYVKYAFGGICCHVDAVHAAFPKADRFTDEIAAGVMDRTGCAGIIGTVSRTIADLNRPPGQGNDEAVWEYREVIGQFLAGMGLLAPGSRSLARPYLHIGIHGMKDQLHGPFSIEVGTIHGRTCSVRVRRWFGETLKEKVRHALPAAKVIFDKHWLGNPSLAAHRWGEGQRYPGYGKNYNAFQVEIARTLREYHRQTMIDILADVVTEFNVTFSRR
ncbi:hypothetical protein [Sporomusa acidovorans]|uniref:N-formylglutamate amidohydrolase n=1 Tax=Sporomusa acidovorans (strain ATCC 49682 / DSM 3132 / Mol) TaxID=1123286 RepID=A0ABZ3IWS9_SPOA4|nr:hypothetical protein [Sporomusa acidovorans]OZC23590.1 N-formylglutamate amidohydrolase [Sporomusa acidovorans DSM 3132]SDE21856.1 hypothetical protein SAMN04488499_101016 [Sporomusa acidovorans]